MKAFLLAAGLGTRLKPITNDIPKCLVQIQNKPLLGWWIDLFEKHNVTDVLINLHHFHDQVISYIESTTTKINFSFFYENKLLGSAGTLRENKSFADGEREVIVAYADNLTNYNLSQFVAFHNKHKMPFSMALYKTVNPSGCGIAQLNSEGIVTDFEEKPLHPKSDLANAGIYITNRQVFDLIPEKELTDIAFDLLPQLVNQMAGWISKDFLMDIGTIENLNKSQNIWHAILRSTNEV